MPTRRAFLRTSLSAASALALGTKSGAAPAEAVTFLGPDDAEYATARALYNGGIATQPKRIARCLSEAGVRQALRRAIDETWPVAVKAGGHCFEGFSLNDDGLVVEVSAMNDLRLDARTGVLTAGAGCRLADVNRFLLARGRFLPAGSCEKVGLAGLTLGGGYGLFARKWGLTCDHLRAVRMVDGTGEIRDSRDDAELLWACRGGGNGNFGVVTQLTLQTRPAPRLFTSWKFRAFNLNVREATTLLAAWFEATPALPRDAFSAWVMNGRQVTILLTTIGAPGDPGIAAFHHHIGTVTDRASAPGTVPLAQALPRYYGEPGPQLFKNCSAGFYRGFADLEAALPAVFAEVLHESGMIFQVNTLGGAIASGPAGAYPHREFGYLGEQQAFWENPAHGPARIAAAGRIRGHLAAAGIRRHYVNYPDLAFADWPTAYYGAENYRRLQALKLRYDPHNRIRHPQSVSLPE
ncbi:MAG: FAD-binding oxidoreductase [Chthoniobacter sp.]|nr:FAD-binding oxidoreductase [Chthoniobacter sp.]